jgi:ATP-binding cassette subfamily F protein 3
MLQMKSLSKQYGSKVLFEDADANLGEKSRIALVGPNGAGKSTLIRLILGQENYDHGTISMSPHVKIGYLAQELPKFENRTVMEEVMRLDGRREEILAQKKDLEEKMQHLTGGKGDDAILQAYSRVLEEVDALDEYRLPSRAEQILEGVGFRQSDFHRNLSELSGGWLMRVALGRVLLLQPDLLILDEPTNHLDLESLLWLEEFLKNYPGAILMVSHDRLFLNKLVNEVWELDQKKINCYNGNLDSFVIQKEERLTLLQSQFEGQQQKIAELQSFIDRFGAKATKARQAQSRQKQIDKMELIEMPEDRSNMQFRFPPCPSSGKEVVTMKKAAVKFGEKTIFQNFNWILQRGSRVAIVGVNGAGKTTLLKTLAQGLETEVTLSEGSLKLGHNVKVGYYSQMQAETLNLDWTILQELESTAPHLEIAQVRAIAGAFLFTGDDVLKKIKVLSGGEKARVALAKLLLTPNNFLLLDEPTNHLDADSREVLLQALMNYNGTLCLVSHDRDFVAPLVDQLLEIQDQKVTPLIMNYEEYLAKKVQETREKMRRTLKPNDAKPTLGAVTHQLSGADSASVISNESSAQNGAPKISNNQRRAWENELKKVEKEIAELEKRQYELSELLSTQDFSNKASDLRALIEEQTKNQQSMDTKMARWEELGTLL